MTSVDAAIMNNDENNIKSSEKAVNITSSHDVRNMNEQNKSINVNNNSKQEHLSTPPTTINCAQITSAQCSFGWMN